MPDDAKTKSEELASIKRKPGRPRAITPEVADEIFCRIMCGNTVYSIGVNDDDMPALDTIYKEIARNAEFSEGLAHARKIGAYALAESVITIADSAMDEEPGYTQAIVNMCRQRQWLAGRYNDKFADKHEVIHKGQMEHVHSLENANEVLTDVFGRSLTRRGMPKIIEGRVQKVEE